MISVMSLMLSLTLSSQPPAPANWCEVGQKVMIPDGREGPVTSVSGEICRVLVYGEKHPTPWAYFLIEPSTPRYGR